MREQTRVYTSALPRINLQFLANLQSRLVDSSPKTHIFVIPRAEGCASLWPLVDTARQSTG